MIRRRERFPYEWQIALSGALLVGMSTVLPSTPFSGLLILWSQWIGEPLLRWHLVGAYDGAVFLPPITALALAYPLLVLSDQVLGRPRRFSFLARSASVLLFLLSGMAIADAALTLGMPMEVSQIVVSCGVGILFVVLGIGLHGASPLAPWIRTIGSSLAVAGACIASFVFLPVGLVALVATYVGLAISLVRREALLGRTDSSPAARR
jgi:hypothetical protein